MFGQRISQPHVGALGVSKRAESMISPAMYCNATENLSKNYSWSSWCPYSIVCVICTSAGDNEVKTLKCSSICICWHPCSSLSSFDRSISQSFKVLTFKVSGKSVGRKLSEIVATLYCSSCSSTASNANEWILISFPTWRSSLLAITCRSRCLSYPLGIFVTRSVLSQTCLWNLMYVFERPNMSPSSAFLYRSLETDKNDCWTHLSLT